VARKIIIRARPWKKGWKTLVYGMRTRCDLSRDTQPEYKWRYTQLFHLCDSRASHSKEARVKVLILLKYYTTELGMLIFL
jgi:hypothetical protein